MKLIDYLRMKKMTYQDFSDFLGIKGVSPSTISLWVTGKRKPNLNMALKVKIATGGEVRPEDF